MTVDQLINLLAVVTVTELMLTVGLGATIAELAAAAREWRGVTRALVANYVLVPAAALGLVVLFRVHPLVAAGVMIVAVCPGAPYSPPLALLARGNVNQAVGLMVILSGSSAVLAPLLLKVLLPLVMGDGSTSVDAPSILRTLVLVQFLPLSAGLGFAALWPNWARRLQKPLRWLSVLLAVALIGIIVAVQFQMFAAIRVRGYVAMLAFFACSAAAGWLLGSRDAAQRRTLAVTTSARNVGVVLVIAGQCFPNTPAVTFATAYAVLQTVVAALVAVAIGRYTAAHFVTPPAEPIGAPPAQGRSAPAT